jgi:hypothetical protein
MVESASGGSFFGREIVVPTGKELSILRKKY